MCVQCAPVLFCEDYRRPPQRLKWEHVMACLCTGIQQKHRCPTFKRRPWKETVRSETIPAANRVACEARKATHAGHKWTLGWDDTCRNLESPKVQRNWESVRLALADFAAFREMENLVPHLI
jgi:hypothetical protein